MANSNEELIDSYIDLAAIGSQTDAFLAQVKRLNDGLDQIGSKSINLSGFTGTKELMAEIKQLNAAMADLSAQKKKLLEVDLEQLKIDRLAKEEKKQAAQQAKTVERALQAEAKAVEDLGNDYKQLSKAYADATARAKSLALTAPGSAVAKQASADAFAIGALLKKTDADVNQFQRNVGNYSGALGKAFGVLKTAANILPGIGIAGLIGFIAEPFIALGKAIFTAKDEVGSFADTYKKNVEVFAGAKGEYTKAVTDIDSLKNSIQAAKDGFRDKDDVVKNYNDTLGKTLGAVSSLDELEQKVASTGDAYILFTLKKAAAAIAANKAADQLFQAEEARQKKALDFQSAATNSSAVSGLNLGRGLNNTRSNDAAVLKAQTAAAEVEKRRVIKEAEDSANEFRKIEKAFLDQANELSKKFGINQDPAKGGKGSTVNRKANQAVFDPNDLKEAQDYYKALSELDSQYIGARLANRETSLDFEKAIIKGEQDTAIANERAKVAAVKAEKDVSAVTIANAESDAATAIDKINIAAKAKLIAAEKKYSADLIDIRATTAQRRAEAEKADAALFVDGTGAALAAKLKRLDDENKVTQSHLAENRDILLADLEKNRKFDEKGERDYQQRKLDINNEYLRASLKANIAYTEAIIKLSGLKGADLAKAEAEIASLKKQLAELDSAGKKLKIKIDLSDLEKLGKKLQEIADVVSKSFSVIGGILNANIVSQKNALQEQSDAIDKKSAKEIEAITNSTASEQDKAAKIAIINARAQAQKEQIDRKNRLLDQQKAQFEKIANIANIITSTALAVVKALPNIPLAIAVGALGAAELAIAIATPIPKYKYGTTSHKGGLAIVGDGGQSELVVTPGGDMIATPAHDTLMNLPMGAQVFPNLDKLPELFLQMSMKPLRSMPAGDVSGNKEMIAMMQSQMNRLEKAVLNRPVEVTRLQNGELRKMVDRHNGWTDYVNSMK